MKQLGLEHFTDLYLTSAGLLIFFFFFVSMLVWVFSKGNREKFQKMSLLPLEQEGASHE